MNGWRMQSPGWLLLLLVVPLIGWMLSRRGRRATVLYSSTSLFRGLRSSWTIYMKRALPWLRGLGFMLLVIGLARPQKGLQEFRLRTEGVAIQMCIDRSGSMLGMDFQLDGRRVNRLTAVKHVFEEFVLGDGKKLAGRADDRIGLISFGGFAEGRVPLTLDHPLLVEILRTIEVTKPILDDRGQIVNEQMLKEERATAIGDALALGVDRLKDSDSKSKVIILLSDGENTAGIIDPEEAAETAKTFGIKIYSIGVGQTGYALFPTQDRRGRERLQRQLVRLDEATLRMLADKTDGKYFNASSTAALANVYQQIDQLEKTESKGHLYTEYKEWFALWVIPGCLLLLFHLLLTSTWFQSIP